VAGAQRGRQEPPVVEQFAHADHRADLRPQPVVAGGDREPAVLGGVGLVGGVARVRRTQLDRVAAGAEVLAGLQRRDRERGREHRHVDAAAGPAGAHRAPASAIA
jgi:hypothetical protein